MRYRFAGQYCYIGFGNASGPAAVALADARKAAASIRAKAVDELVERLGNEWELHASKDYCGLRSVAVGWIIPMRPYHISKR